MRIVAIPSGTPFDAVAGASVPVGPVLARRRWYVRASQNRAALAFLRGPSVAARLRPSAEGHGGRLRPRRERLVGAMRAAGDAPWRIGVIGAGQEVGRQPLGFPAHQGAAVAGAAHLDAARADAFAARLGGRAIGPTIESFQLSRDVLVAPHVRQARTEAAEAENRLPLALGALRGRTRQAQDGPSTANGRAPTG